VSLRQAWDDEADRWIRFARDADVYAWRFNLPAFLELVPAPGRLTVDVGCGEGRVARLLVERGHAVKGVDGSQTLVHAARAGDPPIDAVVADAAAMPLADAAADLAVSFMTLQSVDNLVTVVAEIARVLAPGGRLCAAVVHPMNSVANAPGGYFSEHRYAWESERSGFDMTFHDVHRPLAAYFAALEGAGLAVETVREPVPGRELLSVHPSAERWTRAPCFLHFVARKS
jgi:SAM-dependent methyltransferase